MEGSHSGDKYILNRRAFQRMAYQIPLHFSGKEGPPQDALMKDIGAGGVCFRSMDFLPIASRLKIEFSLPPLHETFFTIGQVVWAREVPHISRHEVGIKFLELSEQNQRRINNFVETSLSK